MKILQNLQKPGYVHLPVHAVIMSMQRDRSQKDTLTPRGSCQSLADPCSTFQCRLTVEMLRVSEGNIWANTEVPLIISLKWLVRIINNQLCMCLNATAVWVPLNGQGEGHLGFI